MRHPDLTGYGAIHPFAFIGATDPSLDADNEVAAGKAWIDTSAGFVLKVRNATDDGWDVVHSGMPVPLPSYTVATLPSASPDGQMIFVTDESGGAVPAFSAGGSWLRVTDRSAVS